MFPKMFKHSVPLVGLLLMSCSTQEPRGVCGDSFCLPTSAKLIDKKTPGEDFNLYQVEWRGGQFGIYEGNYPQGIDEPNRTALRLPIDQSASLSLSNGQGSIIVDVKKDWPNYLDVMGPCQSSQQCPLKAFAAELSLP